jgi:glyoxylase-like metal-dependent hydrolase (beta-lactamase superfamily II)
VVDPITSKLTLIDTLADEDAHVILEALGEMKRTPGDIEAICPTHCHGSHVAGLATIKRLSGAPVLSHAWEAPKIDGREKPLPVGYDFPKPVSFASFEVYALQLGLNAGLGKHKPAKVDGTLKDGMKVGPLQVMEVPGHTPGCLAFYWSERKALIAGDAVASWPEVSPGWVSFNLDDTAQARSIGRMADLSDLEWCCVGHGDPIPNAADVLRSLKA